MKIFSKFTFICNLCFVMMVVMHFINTSQRAKGGSDVVIPLPFAEATMAVLGILSLVINAVFCLVFLLMIRTASAKRVPLWIVIANFIFLLAQVYWFLIDKSR